MTMLTAKEVAQRLDTDPRTLRKFLRSPQGFDSRVGKGQRWAIEAKQVRSLQKRFIAWNDAKNAKNASNEAESTETS